MRLAAERQEKIGTPVPGIPGVDWFGGHRISAIEQAVAIELHVIYAGAD